MADQFETNLPMRIQRIPENSGIINNLQQEWTPHQLHIQYQLYSGQHRGIYYAKLYGLRGEVLAGGNIDKSSSMGKKGGKEKGEICIKNVVTPQKRLI